MKETLFFEKLPNKAVRCQTCAHFCVREVGDRGLCGVRENIDGKMEVLNYGQLISQGVDPIEKKPFFHFMPCSLSLSIAAAGCNFSCGHCQNWQISQIKEIPGKAIPGDEVPPDSIITDAKAASCASIAYTYTEPTIFVEYALEVMKLAHKEDLKNCWVSNGYMSTMTREKIIPSLDAINIDLKAYTEDFYKETCRAKLAPVIDNIIAFKKAGIWVELTTLLIPTLNDSPAELQKIADFIRAKVGTDTPWHISRFSPEISYKMQNLTPTTTQAIEKAVEIGQAAGLEYVYAGNIPGHDFENTYCPKCHKLIIERTGFACELPQGKPKLCPKCKSALAITW